jgi:serine phosphatase RsbU (regulator of sigma subunit)
MSKNILRSLTLVVTVVAALFLSGCRGNSKEQERLRRDAENMVYEAYIAKDYPRIIELVDSLKPLGSISEGKADYWLGYAYDRKMLLYTDGLNEAENRQQEQYGDERIVELLTSLSASSCRDIVEALKADTDRFRDGAEPNDDLTLLAFSFTAVH